jgi:hypothetical protein
MSIEALENKLFVVNEYGYKHQDPNAKPDPRLVEHYKDKYGIRTDVHRTCINCQIRQISKYKSAGVKEFKIACSYIPRALPAGASARIKDLAIASDIPLERAKKILLSTIDPVAWSELMFGFSDDDEKWSLRPYQKEQLRCTAFRTSIREGRRAGKTFAMALKLIHYAYNLKVEQGRDAQGEAVLSGPIIMVVTPYQSQLINIFNEIEALIKRNVELTAAVSSGTGDNLYIKTPMFKMEFVNGARIVGFVSGLGVKGDGSGGGTIRGASADIIYLDEMDMIPEEILDKVITPILLTKPEVWLLATSTPIGKRAKFYSWCLDRPDFKEDYYPSSVLPHWDKIKEELEKESTKESFAAEYMAEFVESKYGVFRPSWIQAARADYTYEQVANYEFLRNRMGISDPANMIICMGIDWNKNAGTEFFVIGYSASSGRWIALEGINVAASEFSAKKWMEEVIRLNYKWKPDWIYADEGYGHTIIEDILLYAHRLKGKPTKSLMDKETVKLEDRLVSFNFSSNVELRDPIDGSILKKPGKHFIVENAVRIIEDGKFFYPESDEVLTKQLMNYIIVRRSGSTHRPVYGMDNKIIGDHRLDAMMLALAGLSLEESVYSGKSLPISRPALVARGDSSQDDYISPHQEADDIIRGAQKHGVPVIANVLKIIRGQGLEDDRLIKQKYKAEEQLASGHFGKRRSRGEIGRPKKDTESIFGGLAKKSNHGMGHEFDMESINSVKELSKPHRVEPCRRGPSRRKGRGKFGRR